MTKRTLLGLVLASVTGSALAADISSVIFFDYTHDATEGGTSDGAFNFVRSYLTVSDKPVENLAYRVQFDAGQVKSYTLANGTTTVTDSDGDTVDINTYSLTSADAGFYVYVKSACVDWTTPAGVWTIGVQPTNLNYTQDATFGNRFLDLPLMDAHGFTSSADLGLRWGKEFGLVKTSLMVQNGAGYKKAENDRFKKISLNLAAGEQALNKKDGWNAGLVYSMEPYFSKDAAKIGDRTVQGVFGGWAGMGLRLGLEIDTKVTTEVKYKWNVATSDTTYDAHSKIADQNESIIGLTCDYKLPFAPGVAVFGRLDLYDPNVDEVNDDDMTSADESKNNETTILVGAKWQPTKGLVIAPNLKMISYEDSSRETATYYRVNFEFKI